MKGMGKKRHVMVDVLVVAMSIIVYFTPFYFILINSLKNSREAARFAINFPTEILFPQNYVDVVKESNYMIIRAFFNSLIITVGTIILLVLCCSMAGYVLQRRRGKNISFINMLFLSGLMLPPSILPTIWVMDAIGIYRLKTGMILIEVALHIPLAVMLYRGYVGTIPREIEEAAYVDGCTPFKMFQSIIFPLLKPVTATVIVLNAVGVFNDFVNPLYFLPGGKNATIQLTLYNFMGLYHSSWHLMFADVVLISIFPLLMFIFFNKRIVAGMTAGAIKG